MMKINIERYAIFLLISCLFLLPAFAAIRLPSIFTDNMVLQQNSSAAIWGWASANKNVTLAGSWDKKTYSTKADAQGRWKIMVSTPSAGGPYTITLSDGERLQLKNVLIGEVWICSGQSNMEMPMKGYKGQPIAGGNEAILRSKNSQIRIYTVPRSSQVGPQDNSKPSTWKEAGPEAVSDFGATSYFFGKTLYELLGVPIGLINSSYGGSSVETWMSREALASFPEISLPAQGDSIKNPFRTATGLFNGMIHPLVGYGIRGAIFYQGESNYDRPDQYESLFPAMVKNWRSLWGQGDFPFYYVQIAPYNYAQLAPFNSGGKYNSAYIRDAQRKSVSKIPQSGMAVLMDLGEENYIHPATKKQAGDRLAYLALGKTYGIRGFAFESPAYDSMIVTGNVVELRFKNADNGLTAYGKDPAHFEIAGADKIFYKAKAHITRTGILVSSPQVKEPVAVRYAFRDFIVGDIFSTDGLPVSSFRTDNW